MDYKKLIYEAIEIDNWDEVVRLATEKRDGAAVICGMKKGVINLFKNAGWWEIKPALEEAGYKVFEFYGADDVNRAIKNKEITPEIIRTTPVVVFAPRSTAVARIPAIGVPIQFLTLGQRNKYDKITNHVIETCTVITNKSTNETLKIKHNKDGSLDTGVFKALLRDFKINSILEDE